MQGRELGALFLVWLTACAGTPRAVVAARDPHERALAATEYELREFTAGAVEDAPVEMDSDDHVAVLKDLVGHVRPSDQPLETARRLLEWEREAEFLVHVEDGQVVWAAPLDRKLPRVQRDRVALTRQYLDWCEEEREGGDCIRLLRDGPVLQDDDLYAVAMAMALDSAGVQEETWDALKEMAHPQAVLASLVCAATVYFMLWVVPEPVSKGVAAVLTAALMAWLGVNTVWGLMAGWIGLVERVDRATTLAQLREAGHRYGRVLGENSARVLVLLITAALGGATGHLATKLSRLPGFARATVQAEAQGGFPLSAAAEVESVAASSEGSFSILMRSRNRAGSASPAGPSRSGRILIRHQDGNRQVVLNEQRWHVPKNKSVKDIPTEDPVGDQLQEAARHAADQWHPGRMSQREANAIDQALAEGKHWLARLLEREARGRYVHREVAEQFKHLRWNRQGVDAVDPKTGYKYELLTRSPSNMERHGRRMTEELFRMISF